MNQLLAGVGRQRRHRERITFRKYGDLRFIGHRDLVRVFERMLRRTGVGLALSQGFHPKAKLSFPLALAVGIEGARELLEVEFSEPIDVEALAQRLAAQAPPGLEVRQVRRLAEGEKKLQPSSVEYRIQLPASQQSATQAAIDDFLANDSYRIERPGRKQPIDARADIQVLDITDGQLRIVQRLTPAAAASPREMLTILNLDHLERAGFWLTRTSIDCGAACSGSSSP
jgi:radical SAM-linked protein